MNRKLKVILAVAVVAPLMTLGGCATKNNDELNARIQRAQDTADQALALAQECNQKCDRMFQESLRK